jgi:hypothetical protein
MLVNGNLALAINQDETPAFSEKQIAILTELKAIYLKYANGAASYPIFNYSNFYWDELTDLAQICDYVRYTPPSAANMWLSGKHDIMASIATWEAPTPALSIVDKPAMQRGSAVHFKGFGIDAWLTVLMVIPDEYKRFETYLVQNPFWPASADSSPFMPVINSFRFGNSHISELRHEPQELTSLEWRLVTALFCYEQYAIYKELAQRHQSTAFSTITTAPIKTRHGFGFHDEIEGDWHEGDSVKQTRRMAKAQEWHKLYEQAVAGAFDNMQSMVMSGKV